MSDGIIVIGAGGHAKVIADIILCCGDNLVGFLDDKVVGEVFGYPIIGTIADVNKYQDDCFFVMGIGNNELRKAIAEQNNVRWHTAVHPSAIIARDATIGEGSVVMAGAIINASAVIGRHCIVNTAAVIEHDSVIGDYVHISPKATLCGTVNIGELTHIGAGVTVKNNTSICNGCLIGMGATVVKNIEETGTYVGSPARKIE